MKRVALFAVLFMVDCDSCETKNKVVAVDAGQDISVSTDVSEHLEEVAVNQGEETWAFDVALNESNGHDFFDSVIDSAIVDITNTDEINISMDINSSPVEDIAYISCGDFGNCPSDFICIDQNLCCPKSMPQECGGQCFPADCQCQVDGDYILCIPDNMEYCGNGISCPKDECWLDGENYYCIPKDEEYCGGGVVCGGGGTCFDDLGTFYCVPSDMDYCGDGLMCKKNGEECQKKNDKFFCVPLGYFLCEGQDKWCANYQVCTETSCCPKEQPIECGQTCCYTDELCVDAAKSVCLPKDGEYCNGAVCVAGETCAPNSVPDCYPETADFCDDGRWCPPGTVCSIGEKGDCCPQGQPQRCGKVCCPENYDCVETDFGKKCIYPGAEPCADGSCKPGEFCANEILGTCAEDGSEVCADGHICEPGTYCAGPTCCSLINANQSCGMLCCPSNWQCINGGEACIPASATYLGNGKYCGVGTFFNKENGNCDPVGWEPCGAGPACKPNTTCAKDDALNIKQCCPADQATFCGDKCCYTGFQCFHDGAKNVCIPPGADYCWGKNVNEWCPPATTCGKKGKKCIPVGAMECNNGDFCPIAEKCTESQPECCPWAAPIPCVTKCCTADSECKTLGNGQAACCKKGAVVCGDICCPLGFYCEEYNGKQTCIPPDYEVCQDTIIGDTMCNTDDSFCESDGMCLDNLYQGQPYDYCGGGKTCPIDQNCGGLCSDICCEKESENEEEKCNLESCLLSVGGWGTPKPDCQDKGTTITCCSGNFSSNSQWIINQIKKCVNEKCNNLNCGQGTYNKFCCTYDKPKTVGCLAGCVPAGRLCYDMPSSAGSLANPIESSILPEEVPFEIGDQCHDDWAFSTFSPILGWLDIISGVQVYFHPAGFGPKYYNDIFHVEDDLTQWIPYNSGDEILVVESVWMVDNLEGNNCPHGPYAQFYILVHLPGAQPNIKKFTTPEIKSNALYGAGKYQLKGPIGPPEGSADSWEFCWCIGFDWLGICWDAYCVSSYGDFDSKVKEEWIDYIFMNYTSGKAAIHKWGSEAEIYLTLRESDGEPEFGRVDDYMGLIKVEKEKTKNACGKTYKLNVYNNTKEDNNPDNDWDVASGGEGGTAYHYPTNKDGAHLRLRTIIVP